MLSVHLVCFPNSRALPSHSFHQHSHSHSLTSAVPWMELESVYLAVLSVLKLLYRELLKPAWVATECPLEAFNSPAPACSAWWERLCLLLFCSLHTLVLRAPPQRWSWWQSRHGCPGCLSSLPCPIIHLLPCLLCFIVPNTASPVLLLELQEDKRQNHTCINPSCLTGAAETKSEPVSCFGAGIFSPAVTLFSSCLQSTED